MISALKITLFSSKRSFIFKQQRQRLYPTAPTDRWGNVGQYRNATSVGPKRSPHWIQSWHPHISGVSRHPAKPPHCCIPLWQGWCVKGESRKDQLTEAEGWDSLEGNLKKIPCLKLTLVPGIWLWVLPHPNPLPCISTCLWAWEGPGSSHPGMNTEKQPVPSVFKGLRFDIASHLSCNNTLNEWTPYWI